ncbi:MAG: Sec-independent protein translocase subunit TatA/TatB [Bacteroidia bacterium]
MNHLVLLGIFGLGFGELLIILFLVLLFFGGKKIPQIMRGIGQGISEFKKAKNGENPKLKDTNKKVE